MARRSPGGYPVSLTAHNAAYGYAHGVFWLPLSSHQLGSATDVPPPKEQGSDRQVR